MRKRLALLAAGIAVAGCTLLVPGLASAATGCQVTYTVANQWPGGFTTYVDVKNLGDATNGWTLAFAFPAAGQTVSQGWSATWAQSGLNVTATNLSWNANLGVGQSTQIGFNGAFTSSNPVPTSFSLNGVVCNGGTPPTTPPPTSSSPPANRAPAVSLTSPGSGAVFSAPATVTITATATDPDAGDSVSKVEFYNGSSLLGTDTGAPYSYGWTNVPAGSYTLTAKAYDTHSAATTSAAVPISVTSGPPQTTAPALHVSGNTLVTATGSTYRLLGANRSGGEFMCVQGRGIWDGPTDDASIDAMKTWNIRALRIPLNEECWLGLSNIQAQYGGTTYQNEVKAFVSRLIAKGITPIVEMHWNYGQYTGPSSGCSDVHATCQKPMVDAQYGPQFWTGVANAFKGTNSVVFDLFNEPYPERATGSASTGWACWRDGGTCSGIGYQVAGMQTLLNAVRGTGASNVVMLGGLAYSNDISQWLTYRPTDATGNLAAAWHVYNFNSCVSSSCWDSQLAPVAAQVPLVAGEIGENTCGHSFIDQVMSWLDAHGVSYLGWTWNTWDCSSGPSLISGYDGTPTNYGVGLRTHLLGQ